MIDGAIDHVAIAVRSIPDAIPFYEGALGATFLMAGDQRGQGFRWAQWRFPHGGKIELVTPLSRDGFVARFLERRGEGVHHVTIKVPDIVRALDHLAASGVPVLRASIDRSDWKEAFVHPEHGHGVLLQIAQSAWSDEDVARHHLEGHEDADHRHVGYADLFTPPDLPG